MAMTINSMFKHCKYVHHDDENNVCFVHERLGEEKMPSVRKLLQTFPATCHLLAVTTIASAFVFCIMMMMILSLNDNDENDNDENYNDGDENDNDENNS